LQASLQQAQTELRKQEVAIATREGEFKALQSSSRLLHQKIDTVVFEVQSLAAQEDEGLQKRESLALRQAELDAREREGQETVAVATAELEALRQSRDAANTALTESKVALASDEQLASSCRHQRKALEERIRELNHTLEQRKGECSGLVTRQEQARLEIQDSRSGPGQRANRGTNRPQERAGRGDRDSRGKLALPPCAPDRIAKSAQRFGN
jgi:chromosome segregation protein